MLANVQHLGVFDLGKEVALRGTRAPVYIAHVRYGADFPLAQQFSQCLLATAIAIVLSYHDHATGASRNFYDPCSFRYAGGEGLFDHDRQTSLQRHDRMDRVERSV